ncbi:MAG: endo-1,4-beta-xylanase [Gemmataceae bacterium]|nr:endo-1,4-beta-xylanase [Gemmataceae bacterium]
MGTINFLIPNGLSPEAVRELERACVTGGPDNMPWPTQVRLESNQLVVSRDVDESGCLAVPWDINGAGRVMSASATLMERDLPYHFQIELARGKVNQLRCQASDWRSGGLQMPPELQQKIREASLTFGRAATQMPSEQAIEQAQAALNLGYRTAEELVRVYIDQVFQVRHQRQPRLDTTLGCRLGSALPEGEAAASVAKFSNSVFLPLAWKDIEPAEASYSWEPHDAMLDWAESQGLPVSAGPLIDFSPNQLPKWLWLWERDLHSIASFMCDYVETAVKRYHGRIRSWQLTAASNSANVLSLGEDELLWLTVRLAEAARQIDSGLELVVGLAQPWGDYMAMEDRTHSPFIFADTLIRAGLNLAAVDLEWVMGPSPHGSYCRDALEASRLLDLYALLGVPLQVTLGYPSSAENDDNADPDLAVTAGHWHGGYTPDVQAEWATAFGALALCKPYVRGVHWTHLSDAQAHQFPNCGLVDAGGKPKPALESLRQLREQHLH